MPMPPKNKAPMQTAPAPESAAGLLCVPRLFVGGPSGRSWIRGDRPTTVVGSVVGFGPPRRAPDTRRDCCSSSSESWSHFPCVQSKTPCATRLLNPAKTIHPHQQAGWRALEHQPIDRTASIDRPAFRCCLLIASPLAAAKQKRGVASKGASNRTGQGSAHLGLAWTA